MKSQEKLRIEVLNSYKSDIMFWVKIFHEPKRSLEVYENHKL